MIAKSDAKIEAVDWLTSRFPDFCRALIGCMSGVAFQE
jgi:hypothetical protein